MNKELVLITGSYPYSYSGENTFLPQEIEIYKRYFDKITIIPKNTLGGRLDIDDSNIVVNLDYSSYVKNPGRKFIYFLYLFLDFIFLQEIIINYKIIFSNPSILIRIVKSRIYSRITRNWFETNFFYNENTFFLTWWFDETTNGIIEANLLYKSNVISRAHGYDLYFERHISSYIPFRSYIIKKEIRVYPDSHFGVDYLKKHYPDFHNNFYPGILGIDDFNFLNYSYSNDEFKILSCSFLNEVKRVKLILESIIELSKINKEIKISWTHIGDGPDKTNLIQIAETAQSTNLHIEFLDYPGKEGLVNYYKNNSIDLFVNLSLSEGTPISIMEAISVGIPILATSVGGNKEIVTHKNGFLISTDLNSLEISIFLNSIINKKSNLNNYRIESRLHFENNYNAKINYDQFCKKIFI